MREPSAESLPTTPPTAETVPSATISVVVALLVLGVQILAIFNPAVVEVDHEEMFNAGQAWALLNGHATDLFRLQYREFCGGCTADALLAVPLFATLGPRWAVWKLVPIVYSVAFTVVAHRVLTRRVGPLAGAAVVGLMLFPPRTFLHLSLIGWGNHFEAGMVAATGLLLVADALYRPFSPLRWVATGAVLGAAVWIGFSGTYCVVAAVLLLVLLRRWKPLGAMVVGVALGVSPWLLQWWTTHQHPFVTIYEEGESVPLLTRIPAKIRTLVAPRQLAALFGVPDLPIGYAAGIAWAASFLGAIALLARTGNLAGRAILAGLFSWLAIYSVVRFQVAEPDWPGVAVPGSCRYAAPLFPLAFLALAVGFGTLWKRNQKRLAGSVLLLPLLVGIGSRAETLKAPFPAASVWTMHAVDWPYFRNQFSYVVSQDAHLNPTTADPFSRNAHAYGAAREMASAMLRDQAHGDLRSMPSTPSHLPVRGWWQGIGDALGSFHQNRIDGTLAILRRSAALLEETPGATPANHQRALRGVAAWQMHAGDLWIRAIDRHDAGTFLAVHGAVDAESPAISDAAWWAVGFTWAHHVAGWHQPTTLSLPEDPQGLPNAFVEGMAYGLAEEWGPRTSIERLPGLPASAESAFRIGWADGLEDRWFPPYEVPAWYSP